MITTMHEFEKAQEELRLLESRLQVLRKEHPVGFKGFTKAGIHKMIARLHDELAVFEAGEESKRPISR